MLSMFSRDKLLSQLQQQIELATSKKIANYSFVNEIAIKNFIHYAQDKEKDPKSYRLYRNYIKSLLSYLLYLFESSDTDPNKFWLLHQIILKFLDNHSNDWLEDIIGNQSMIHKIKLLADKDFINLSMICSLKLTSLQPCAIEFYRKLQIETVDENSEIVQGLCIKLRNSLYQDSRNTSLVLKILSEAYLKYCQKNGTETQERKLNIFEKIYSQALIHALKNQNKHLMIQIFLRSPDRVFTDDNLVRQIIDCFIESNSSEKYSDLMSLYSYALFCTSPKFIKFISNDWRKFNENNLQIDSFFELKQCFVWAMQKEDKKHFLREFIDFQNRNQESALQDLSLLPFKAQIMISVLSLYQIINNHQEHSSQDKICRIEANLYDLFGKLNDIESIDDTFMRIAEKIHFVLKFSDWCYAHFLNHQQTQMEKFNFRYSIIAQLMSGTSPLKILSNYNFFELDSKMKNISFQKFKEEILCDYICDIIEKFDPEVSMILKGFIVIRLVIFCIFSKETENFYFDSNQIQLLLQNIYPVEFRLEIMENLFGLLFITRNDIKKDTSFSEDEEYFDDTIDNINTADLISQKTNKTSKLVSEFSRTVNFVCPNWLIPKLLEILKDMLYKTSSDLFKNRNNLGDEQNNKEGNINKLKNRINQLMKYVSDAQFRYDVIRPAFFKNVEQILEINPNQNALKLSDDQTVSTTSSDLDQKSDPNRNTSLISCMLASHTQLLCYTLTEHRLDSSRQIAKLFENDLKNSKPYKELQLLDYHNEFHHQVCNVRSHFSDGFPYQRQFSKESNNSSNSSTKRSIDEITSLGIRSSRVQSLLYEMLMKMDPIEMETKIIFMLDYALSLSPSMEISQSILESVFIHNQNLYFHNQSKKILPDKIENFVIEVHKFIKSLSQHLDISQISMSEYLERPLMTFPSNLLDTQAIVDNIQAHVELFKWYHKFYSSLNDLERQIIDEPDSITVENLDDNQSEIQIKSNQLNNYFTQLMKHCPLGKYQYLKALYHYVCKVNKALVECRRRSNGFYLERSINSIDSSIICSTSHFNILKQNPSAILCSMVIKSKMSPKIIDDLAQVMKVNLIGVLCSLYCPTIPSTFLLDSNIEFRLTEICQPSITELIKSYSEGANSYQAKLNNSIIINDYFAEEKCIEDIARDSMETSFQPMINQDVLNYFYSKCSILVQVLRLLNLIDDLQISSIESFVPSLQISSDSPLIKWIDLIKKNFYCGDLSSTLILAFYARIPAGQNAVIKTLEHYTSCRNFFQVYILFQYIQDFSSEFHHQSDIGTFHDFNFQVFQNAIYSCLAFIKEDAKFIFQIVRDPKMKTDLILTLLDSFEIYEQTFHASRLIRLGLQSIHDDEQMFAIDVTDYKTKLEITLKQIEFYASVGQLTGLKTWKSAKNNLTGIDVLAIIKSRKRYSLAIDWYQIRGFENDTSDLLIELLVYAYSELNDYQSLRKLFQTFLEEPKSTNVILITEKILNQAENLDLRTFLLDFLIQYHRKRMSYLMVDQFERYKLGVEMVKLLSHKIQQDYLDLIPIPQLLIEQLLMNSEIESLDKIINQYKLIKVDDLVERYAQKSVYIEVYDCNSFEGSDMTIISSESSQTVPKNPIGLQPQFVVPQKVPSKEQWVSDTSKTHCMLCQVVRFSMINRRHHCRRCGRIVCNGCSSNSLLITEISTTLAVRVCDDCFNWYQKSGRKVSTISMDESSIFPHWNSITSKRTQWKLSLIDDAINQNRRSEFIYESAPSVSLCLAILRLHSNKTKSCKFIIEKICAPLIESLSSRNVDSTLLIEMIRSLLISTRLAFEQEDIATNHNSPVDNYSQNQHHNSFAASIEQLNLYLDRLDVIRMLINANCGSKEFIGYVLNNNIQKLQEKLLESERFELTIDISKKYGIDASSIWKSWALICLKHYHFIEARQRFSRYFDQMNRFTEVQKTLKTIVNTLVSINSMNLKSQISLKDKCQQIVCGKFDFLVDVENVPTNQTSFTLNASQFNSHSQQLKPRIFQEIVYYLETYGTKEDQLNFFVEHFFWKESIECLFKLIEDQPNTNMATVFMQKIFIPAQVNGYLTELFAAIRLCDPQQSRIWSSLISICRHLNKSNHYHTLYRIQVFMNDFLRAAITQINHFFLNPTNDSNGNLKDKNTITTSTDSINLDSFQMLYSRMTHLEKARDYCNMFLHNMDYVKVKQGCLVVDTKDVFKQIKLIELQMDMLKYFHNQNVSYPITVRIYSLEELEHYLMEWPVNAKPLFLSAYCLAFLEESSSINPSPPTGAQSCKKIQIERLLYPPTLLEHNCLRKSLITALIIIYLNNKSDNNSENNSNKFEEGFRCALRIIKDHQLEAELVYKICILFLLAHHLEHNVNVVQIGNDLKQLFNYIQRSSSPSSSSRKEIITDEHQDDYDAGGEEYIMVYLDQQKTPTSTTLNMKQLCDDIIDQCLLFIEQILSVIGKLSANHQNQIFHTIGLGRTKLSELKECLIKLITNDNRRIEAYLNVGKLKLAYLLAASLGRSNNIEKVLQASRQANDQHYVKICEMWLKKNANYDQSTITINK